MRKAHKQVAAIFSEWLRNYAGIPVKIARSFASNPEDQRDLLQEMYLQLWRSIESFAAEARESTWIYRVCLNTAMTWQRTEKRRHRFLSSADLPDFYVSRDGFANAALLDDLYSSIRELRPVDRALILLYLEQRSYREIGEIVGISESNAGVRLQRIKRELAERLNTSPAAS